MRLHRLRLQNFRQHRDTDFELGPGLTGIIGPNGAGKSTLVEAVAWAIYGTEAARGTRDSIRWRHAKPRSEVRVELEFGIGPHEYRVVRTLYGAELYQDASPQPTTTSLAEVTDRLTRVLGMTRDEFFHTYFTGQKDLAVMAAMKPIERGQFLSQVLGYDKLRLAQERVRAARSALKGELTALEQTRADPAALEEEHRRAADQRAQAEDALRRAREAVVQAQRARDQMAPALVELEVKRDRMARLVADRRLTEERLRQADDLFARSLAECEAMRKEAAELRALEPEAERLARRKQELADLERRCGELRTEWVRDRQESDTKLQALLEQYRDLETQRRRILGAGPDGDCPTCGRPLGEEFAAVVELLTGQLEQVKLNGQYFRARLKQLRREPPELAQAEAGRRDLAAELEREPALRSRLERLGGLLQREAALEKELEQQQARREGVAAELGALATAAEGVAFTEPAFQAARQAAARAEAALHDAELARAMAEGNLAAATERLTAVADRRREAEARASKVAQVAAEHRLHGELDRALGDLRTELNQQLRPELAEVAAEFLAALTGGRFDAVDLDENYQLTVLEDGVVQPVISGGEQDLANLVLRLALSQMIADRAGQPFLLLVLDEIFGSLDEAHRSSVLDLLRALEARFPQVIVITHIEGVREGLDRVLRVSYDEAGGVATVTEEPLSLGVGGSDAGTHVAA